MFNHYLEDRRGLGIKPGLERIKDCLHYLGNPQNKFKSVLIAGTNGKGSVTYYLSNLACKFLGDKVGRYISPHLVSWNERYVIDEQIVENNMLENLACETLSKIEEFEKKYEKKI